MTTSNVATDTITVQCEHSEGSAMLRQPRVQCQNPAVALVGRPGYSDARFLCGGCLVEELDVISRVVAITPAAQADYNASNWEIAKMGAELAEARQDYAAKEADADEDEWVRLNGRVERLRGTLQAVMDHTR